MLKEFRDFVMKGNLVELAVALIIGLAFNALVTSLADDVLMQLVAAVVGQPDFSAITWTVNGAAIGVGAFMNALVNFLIIAATIFIVVKAYNRMTERASKNEEVELHRSCPACLSDVALAATRCPACTSALTPSVETATT